MSNRIKIKKFIHLLHDFAIAKNGRVKVEGDVMIDGEIKLNSLNVE